MLNPPPYLKSRNGTEVFLGSAASARARARWKYFFVLDLVAFILNCLPVWWRSKAQTTSHEKPQSEQSPQKSETAAAPKEGTPQSGQLEEAKRLREQGDKLRREGRYDEALPLLERSLDLRERVLGPEHRDVAETLNIAETMNNLGLLLERQGKYARATQLYERALASYEIPSGKTVRLNVSKFFPLRLTIRNWNCRD